MKQYIFAAWLMVCGGCGGETLTSGPNPLETFDQDRLYVLINAAVNRGRAADCARYFQEADNQAADNPDAVFMRAALSQVCPESMVKIASYLEHNGVAGVKAAHVKDMEFWGRMEGKARAARAAEEAVKQAKTEAIRQCQQQLVDRKKAEGPGKSQTLRVKDFPDASAYRAAYGAAVVAEAEAGKKYVAQIKACKGTRESPPSRADLGISLPEGMRSGLGGKIN